MKSGLMIGVVSNSSGDPVNGDGDSVLRYWTIGAAGGDDVYGPPVCDPNGV